MTQHFDIKGLSQDEVLLSRKKHGQNVIELKKPNAFLNILRHTLSDPMVILLAVATLIYVISGHFSDAIFLAGAIVLVCSISLFQYSRSQNALEKLKDFSQPLSRVIRGGESSYIRTDEIVIGDCVLIDEGTMIPADGSLLYATDFSVNESILTGESLAVQKGTRTENQVFSGTTVATGLAIARVTAIGNGTRLGQIGKSLESIQEEKTPLEIKMGRFVQKMALAGIAVFVLVWALNYYRSHDWLSSLLGSLTLAMSILPEEIPVAFTTFMALGAWRLMQRGIVVKQMKTVETLGSATVICTDKTGTITQNSMSLAKLYDFGTDAVIDAGSGSFQKAFRVLETAMWASEPVAFDPMEIALHKAYSAVTVNDLRPTHKLIHEYPLEGKPPMMTHVFAGAGSNRIIAAKGAPEAIMDCCALSPDEKERVKAIIELFANDGFRVLGVASSEFAGSGFPQRQQDLPWDFIGLAAFHDPPKPNIAEVLKDFYSAGIKVKIITGDNAATTSAIARQINFKGADKLISGEELMKLTPEELSLTVEKTAIFTRMFPEAKLRIINALKANNHVVAMTGDGVNDGPALKAAHIGIAMGKKGTGIAKDAASLILLEDDLSKMVEAVAMGRKIYSNLKKAIQYIISIHIPIILTVFIPLAAGWAYPAIFSPIHVIFLELIMGPTCSIIYENEPIEKDAMLQNPRPASTTFFNWKEISLSIVQGLAITAAVLAAYRIAVADGENEQVTRSMVFTTLIAANLFLTLVNRSFYYSVFTTFRYKNRLMAAMLLLTVLLMGIMLYIKPVSEFFDFERLNAGRLFTCLALGFFGVMWFEFLKFARRRFGLRLKT